MGLTRHFGTLQHDLATGDVLPLTRVASFDSVRNFQNAELRGERAHGGAVDEGEAVVDFDGAAEPTDARPVDAAWITPCRRTASLEP